ncbi:helix-turn-helix domain-containing protein [Candidatus Dojkabacteria bacterium]|jgi:hypothetical protein|nr:helix-turn-helix domain-containing protein [Candidatus Dojkabacteria bacterium]
MTEQKPDLKQSVLQILLNHKGKENAITGKNLAQRLNQKDTRKIRLLIEELIEEGYAICSTPHPPHGYFLAVSYQDVSEALKILRNGYALSLLHHYKNLKRAGFNTFSGQIPMFKM